MLGNLDASTAEEQDWKMSANDMQVGGRHYIDTAIQPWDYIASNDLGFFEGNIIKYVSRWRSKDGMKDLEKAQHYLNKLIEVEKGKLDEHDKRRRC